MTTGSGWRQGSVSATRISYLEVGPSTGPVAICVHGFPDTPGTFRELMGELSSAGYRAVAPWLRGYAPSTLKGPYHPRQIAEDILSLADAVSPRDPVILIGHDWGAVATYAALGLAPWRFRAAVTLAIPHPLAFMKGLRREPGQFGRSSYMAFFQLRGIADARVAAGDYRYIEELWRRWSPGWAPPPGHLEEVKMCLSASLPAPLGYYRALMSPRGMFAMVGLSRQLKKALIPVPTLHLHGERDGCVSPELGLGQEALFCGEFRSATLAAAGHWLHMERPAEVWRQTHRWLCSFAPLRATQTTG